MAKAKSQKSLDSWTKEEWGTKSGKNSTQGKNATGERYLPKKAREVTERQRVRHDPLLRNVQLFVKVKQHSKQPEDVAKKTATTPALISHRYE